MTQCFFVLYRGEFTITKQTSPNATNIKKCTCLQLNPTPVEECSLSWVHSTHCLQSGLFFYSKFWMQMWTNLNLNFLTVVSSTANIFSTWVTIVYYSFHRVLKTLWQFFCFKKCPFQARFVNCSSHSPLWLSLRFSFTLHINLWRWTTLLFNLWIADTYICCPLL